MFSVIALGAILGIYWYKKFSRTRPRPVPCRRLEQFPIKEKKSSALVVGGNGSLGKALINCLLSDGTYQVRGGYRVFQKGLRPARRNARAGGGGCCPL